jgi:hypothetical protein
LERQARDFAASVRNVLNSTICTGVRIAVDSSPGAKLVEIGHWAKTAPGKTTPFPVSLGRQKPRCWLRVGYQLSLDPTGRFLTVDDSTFEVYAATEPLECLCHFDYQRGKSGGYPEAHIQVHGKSSALASWSGLPQTRELGRLHLPVGGRRFRPAIEDVIEFLVVEKLADPRDGWTDAVARHREEWERIQLRAAIRADPNTAWNVLREFAPSLG